MSGTFYRFIATKTTYQTTIPAFINSVPELVRRVRIAFLANAGGQTTVGELKDFPLSNAVANYLLCDGSEVAQIDFPELYAYLGDSQGAPVDPDNFVLPDYVGAATPAATYPPQTTEGATVSTGGAITEPTDPGQTGGSTGGNVPSGGRPRRISGDEQEP